MSFLQRLSYVILTTFPLHTRPHKENITIYALPFYMCLSPQITFFSKIRQNFNFCNILKIKRLRIALKYVVTVVGKENKIHRGIAENSSVQPIINNYTKSPNHNFS